MLHYLGWNLTGSTGQTWAGSKLRSTLEENSFWEARLCGIETRARKQVIRELRILSTLERRQARELTERASQQMELLDTRLRNEFLVIDYISNLGCCTMYESYIFSSLFVTCLDYESSLLFSSPSYSSYLID
ncbi:unnamed protein product [Protopolystoma xenopodis]|uniref:Uncharacterized protein n=1 Tax=Protopolystoma xenopodis TaxID=117903 RepID=A0A448WCM1_9PLAT|nr:unnamed protein product [Protopolystoma xenopodis]